MRNFNEIYPTIKTETYDELKSQNLVDKLLCRKTRKELIKYF